MSKKSSLANTDLTARQILEIKGSKSYIIFLIGMIAVALTMQTASGVSMGIVFSAFISFIPCLVISIIIYRRKKLLRSVSILQWILVGYTILLIIFIRLKYTGESGWQYAVESYHISALIVFFLMISYYYYNKLLYKVYTVLVFMWWTAFLLYARFVEGVVFHVNINLDGGGVVHGVVLFREIYYMLVLLALVIIVYRNMPILDSYDKINSSQKEMIFKQVESQKSISQSIKDKMNALFQKVDNQNTIITQFNEMIQSQAATFEEISATLEELLSSSDYISDSAVKQLKENTNFEEIIDTFKELKANTKTTLDSSLLAIEEVVQDTNTGRQKLEEVEKTISELNEQSSRISDTVSIIVDIADRINLLSLNASIEAARAGEYGRGFAVVADEIGKLAFQTSESIKDIENALSQNRETTTEGVNVIRSTASIIMRMIQNMEESSQNIRLLRDSIKEEEIQLKVIEDQLSINLKLSQDVENGTGEQKLAIESSTRAVEDMTEKVGIMATGIRDISKISEEIVQDAVDLLDTTKNSVSDDDGEKEEEEKQ